MINGVNATFTAGNIYTLLGPNGSGKTSLLKLLSGLWLPSSGSIAWQDTPLWELTQRQRSQLLSLVPQAPQPQFDFTVAEIVAMGSYPRQRQIETAAVTDALNQVNLAELATRPITTLSSGERQRAYIARALMTRSPVLLLDEPTANLDIKHLLEIWQLLEKFKGEGKVIIVATHDLNAAERYCNSAILLDKGSCVASGSYNEVITPHSLSHTFGLANISGSSAWWGHAEPADLQEHFHDRRPHF